MKRNARKTLTRSQKAQTKIKADIVILIYQENQWTGILFMENIIKKQKNSKKEVSFYREGPGMNGTFIMMGSKYESILKNVPLIP